MNQIVGINNTFQSYQKLIDFYEVNKDKEFDDIHLTIVEWFSANMYAALGGILDTLSNNINHLDFDFIKYLDKRHETKDSR